MNTLSDETQYTSTFGSSLGEFHTPQFDDDLDAIREAEKKLNREGNTLTIAGLLAVGTGLALFLMMILGSSATLPAWAGLLIAGGVGTVGYGLLKIFGKLRKKSLDFPLLRKIKKAVRQQRTQQQSRTAPRGAQATGTAMFEETYVRNKLAKSTNNKVFLGVCGGIAEYAGISPSLMRFVFLMGLMLSAGVIIPVYVILGLLLPSRK